MTSLAHPQLSGLGRNPAAPRDVLVRLAAHRAGRSGLTRRPGRLEDAVVEALLTHGDRRSSVTLYGDRVSPEMRRRVAEHPDPEIRDAYPDFVRDMVERGVPLGLDDLERVYARPLDAFARAEDPNLRAAIADLWHDRPPAVQAELLADPDPRVRTAATRHERPGIPPEWWERCLADPAVRANAARSVPLTAEQFERLVSSGDEEVLTAVADNPHLSAEMVARLADVDHPHVRIAAALSRHVDAATRDRLYALLEAEYANGSVEAEVALYWYPAEPDWLREAPLDERLAYLDCPHTVFRRALASCNDLPEEAWRRLDDDPDPQVRRIAARRPDTPPDVLERLVREHGDARRPRPLLVDHPNFPRHALRTFVDDPDPRVRRLALHDPELPARDLERLAADPSLCSGVAEHPNVTDALLDRLLSDPDHNVADNAAANPALPLDRMYRILAAAGL
ncbi:hypothetical protein SUDANB121_00979 [Nocardiopsis dassonvillei]|uniref:hypothetical protein n=1 Tax=Nocardiopsis dassonvillei TaxID=2014 RepID=UPI003F5471A5